VVRGADQVVAAQPLQALILPVGHCGGAVAVPAESRAVELADDPDVAVLLLVGVDLVAATQPERAKGWCRPVDAELIAGDAGEKAMQSVITTDVADVLADNDSSSMPRDDEGFVRPTATNCSHTRSCVFHRRVRSVTRSSELTQPGVTRYGGCCATAPP
jgi:hypothetical protein